LEFRQNRVIAFFGNGAWQGDSQTQDHPVCVYGVIWIDMVFSKVSKIRVLKNPSNLLFAFAISSSP
jgi:hypothetical protein